MSTESDRDKERNPWRTNSSRTVYQNPWITVREDQVTRPDGKPGIYSVVDTRIATGVVALNEVGEIYLVGQWRYPLNDYSWEIVEGGADRGENPLDAARRELKEEAGVVASRWLQLGSEYQLSNCFSSEIGYIYLATDLVEGAAEPEGTEVLQVRRAHFRQVMRRIQTGAIKDSITIVAMYRAEKYLRVARPSLFQ